MDLSLTSCFPQDWAKPGPYDQPVVNTLQRRKDKREPDANGAAPSGAPAAPEEPQRPRSMTVSAATRVKLSFHTLFVQRKWPCWLYVVFIWEGVPVWSVGIMQAGRNASLGIDFHRAKYSKKASVPMAKKMAGLSPVGL